ncbi:MAG: acetyl-CoA carboxylase biotin carboxyl carrier protein [Candidatus Margulisbacteria bacterium]|jgi:acetyl-CoA carboxylase biotin carboxyl carrier protein|nr:acetyl-CoA carboxylase biotin carboxyl carrier protein [Candidatus Margulisiibacteriota bacterium]
MDFEVLKKLIQLVKDEDISGVAVEEKGVKYEVRREKGGHVVSAPAPHAASTPAPVTQNPASPKEDEGLTAITSPMVGTFYRSPSPEAPPFVNAGDDVEPGKVVCIIEAMKLFNEIESEVRGKIVKVLVENGKPVEFGQKLFLVKK